MTTRIAGVPGVVPGLGALPLTGMAVVLASVSWTFLSAERTGGSPVRGAATLVGAAVTFAAARSLARGHPRLIPAVVVAVAAGLLATAFGDLVGGTTFGPFGYSNADAAFFTQAMVAAWMVACATRSGPGRWIAFGAGLLFALVPIAGGGRAVVVLFALALAALFAGGRGIPTKAVAVVGGGLFVAGVLVTVVLGATFEGKVSGDVDQLVDATISTRRPELWHDALVLMGEHPLTGVGPGAWAEESPAARADADADQAHNAFLQQGAETGVVGMALLLLIVLWTFAYLASNAAGGAYAALGVAALTAFGLHASIDYIFDFPAVVLATAALVGAAGTGASIRGE